MKKNLLSIFAAAVVVLLFINGCKNNAGPEPKPEPEANTYQVTLSASPDEGGTVLPESGEYEEGSSLEITATPNEGWLFDHWEGDYEGNSSSASITVSKDMDIAGVFVQKEYSLSITIEGEGTVDERVIKKAKDYKAGTVVELAAHPAEGYRFVEWQGALTGSENPVELTMNGEKEITAVFEKTFYLAANGVTIECPAADVGDSGIVNGITYTKRTGDQITLANAPTTCASGIRDMSGMFHNTSFNGDISSWDVSSVTDMSVMFAASSFNGDISSWDVSSVIDMNSMFTASPFSGAIGSWDVSNVTDMAWMFSQASSFNTDISSWNVSSVTDMTRMFFSATSFNRDISGWCVPHIPSEPMYFATHAAFEGDATKMPKWGTCPEK